MVPSPWVSLALLTLVCVSYGMTSSNQWAITQTIAGPAAAGKWTGLQNAFGNLAGVTAPWVTGAIVSSTGRFFYAFLAVSIVVVLGGLSYLFVVGPVKQVEWD
jgi:MFS-type transporter involved in bile tolerance (Atg22 family)